MIFIELTDLLGKTICVNAAYIVTMTEVVHKSTNEFHCTKIVFADGAILRVADHLCNIERCVLNANMSHAHVMKATHQF